MSGIAWGYTFGFAVAAGVIGFLLELLNNHDGDHGHPVSVGITSVVICFIANWLIIYFGLPMFSWWSIDGGAILFFIDLTAILIVSFCFGMGNETFLGAIGGLLLLVVSLIIWGIILGSTTPAWCDDTGLKRMANMLQLQPATSAYPDTDLNEIIRVPESVALSKAAAVLSGGENGSLGSYLAPNRAYIQIIQGKPYYVVDLKVTSWISFRAAGSVLPGYLLVDAVDPNAEAKPMLGYQLHYAPRAQWGNDLDRVVYMNFLLGTNFRIQDLDGMEVDDNFVPYYVGTLENHVIGYQGMGITGLYSFNPETGVGTKLDMTRKPSWLERVFPVEWFTYYASEWGNWANHKPCQLNSTGMKMVDRTNVVATHGGLEYQITMTSVGQDPSLTNLITVDPTTGVSTLYPFTGKTLEAIESMAEVASKKLNANGYQAEGCQIHRLLNRNVAYCMLTYVDKSTESMAAQNDTVLGGYSFVDVDQAAGGQIESVAVGKTFNEAWANFQRIVAQSNQADSLANTQSDVQIVGTVKANQLVAYPDNQNQSFLITVDQNDGTTVYLLAPAGMLNAAVAIPGTTVTATCYQEPGQKYLTVRHIDVRGAPDFGGAFFAKSLKWLRSLWPFK